MAKILVCDDDKEIVEAIEIYLTQDGHQVLEAYDGIEAVEILKKESVDLLIMDIMMPRMDGIRATLKIREKHNIPIIILSAKSEDADKILGLYIGADDYITKPFNPLELTARVKSQLRRYTQLNPNSNVHESSKNEISIRGLTINKDNHKVTVYDEEIKLTPIEFDILWLLCENRGKVISSEELFHKVWKEECYKNSNNTVMVHIRHLREKMNGPTGKSDFIKTVWGVGYKVEE